MGSGFKFKNFTGEELCEGWIKRGEKRRPENQIEAGKT
jgi:hypothetical protein